MWFFSSCNGMLGVPLEFPPGPQGTSRVASGKSGLLGVARGTSGFLLSHYRGIDLILSCSGKFGVPVKLRRVSQGTSGATQKESSLLRWERTQDCAEALQGNWASSRIDEGILWFFSSCSGKLGVLLEW